jgi:hypothetical protein
VIAEHCRSVPASRGFGLLDRQVAPSGSPDSGEPERRSELINEEEFMDIRALHRQGFTYAEIGASSAAIGAR